ncbi:MAG: crossover junction endodeoxyribonuclease RuvC [Oscillospiraceae bacterium]|nr:crossover junction endodeoxyribonuclease RuvC [Oscillospiraceae bacterium]
MVIMGIDPGYAIVGFGIVDYKNSKFELLSYGAVTTEAKTDFSDRLIRIYEGIDSLIKKYRPDAIAIERLYFTSNQKTAIDVAQARGVILLAARQNLINVSEYTPLQVKGAVVGYGKAEKKQVMEMTRVMLGLKEYPKPDDAADALALAICRAHSGDSKRLEQEILRKGW